MVMFNREMERRDNYINKKNVKSTVERNVKVEELINYKAIDIISMPINDNNEESSEIVLNQTNFNKTDSNQNNVNILIVIILEIIFIRKKFIQ